MLLYLALSHGLSSFKYNYTKNNLTYWAQSESVSEQDYHSAKDAIYSANALWSDNPTYLASQANLITWGAYENFETKETLSKALHLYESALESQIMSPWIWSEWVMTKWRLLQYDESMLKGLLYLDRVGPYTAEANIVVVDAGLQLISKRPDFSETLQPVILDHYLRAEYNPNTINQMRSLKKDHGNPDWLPDLVYWRWRDAD